MISYANRKPFKILLQDNDVDRYRFTRNKDRTKCKINRFTNVANNSEWSCRPINVDETSFFRKLVKPNEFGFDDIRKSGCYRKFGNRSKNKTFNDFNSVVNCFDHKIISNL